MLENGTITGLFQDQADYCDPYQESTYKGADHTMCKFCVSRAMLPFTLSVYLHTTYNIVECGWIMITQHHVMYRSLHRAPLSCVSIISNLVLLPLYWPSLDTNLLILDTFISLHPRCGQHSLSFHQCCTTIKLYPCVF